MPVQSAAANTDTNGVVTTSYYGDPGDATNTWYVVTREAVRPASNATTSALAASLVVKASAGVLYKLTGVNTLGSTQYIQVHNATSVPSNGAVPAVCIAVPTATTFDIDFGPRGRTFSTGIVVCNSTTVPTKTLGSANCWFDAQYI